MGGCASGSKKPVERKNVTSRSGVTQQKLLVTFLFAFVNLCKFMSLHKGAGLINMTMCTPLKAMKLRECKSLKTLM